MLFSFYCGRVLVPYRAHITRNLLLRFPRRRDLFDADGDDWTTSGLGETPSRDGPGAIEHEAPLKQPRRGNGW